METRFGDVKVTRSKQGIPTYFLEAFHDGLHQHQLLRASDRHVLTNKSQAVATLWNSSWSKQQATQGKIRRQTEAKEAKRLHLEHQKSTAQERTAEAEEVLAALRNILLSNLELDPTIDWESLKNTMPFPNKGLVKPPYPSEPPVPTLPPQPASTDVRYRSAISLLDHVISSRKAARIAASANQFQSDFVTWQHACADLAAQYQAAVQARVAACANLDVDFAAAQEVWRKEKQEYQDRAAVQNLEVDRFRDQVQAGDSQAVVRYFELVLSRSDYPSYIPREFDLEFNPETGMLLVNSRLPAPDDLPRLAEVKYVQASDGFKESYLSDVQTAMSAPVRQVRKVLRW